MPGLVGGFGKFYFIRLYLFFYNLILYFVKYIKKGNRNRIGGLFQLLSSCYPMGRVHTHLPTCVYTTYSEATEDRSTSDNSELNNEEKVDTAVAAAQVVMNVNTLGPYLAGLIEGDGTIAVHDSNSRRLTQAKKYNPAIIVVFNSKDLPLAKFLKEITNCGTVLIKPNRGYVL